MSNPTPRKKQRVEDNWVLNKQKKLRDSGEFYVSYYTGKSYPAKKSARNFTCKCNCFHRFSFELRDKLFQDFHTLTAPQQRAFLLGLRSEEDVKKPRKSSPLKPSKPTPSKRRKVYKWSLPHPQGRQIVCKNAIMAIFDLKPTFLQTIGKFSSRGDLRCEQKNASKPPRIKNAVIAHINSFKRKRPHYCRKKNTGQEYIEEGGIRGIPDLHKKFLEEHNEDDELKDVKESYYRSVFVSNFNIGFGRPKTDTCSLCDKLRAEGKVDSVHFKRYEVW